MPRLAGVRRWLGVAVSWVLLGVIGGGAWHVIAHPARFTKFGDQWFMGQLALGDRFGVDGWFAVIGAGISALAGLAWLMRTRLHPVGVVVAGVVGSVVAGAIAWGTGLLMAPSAAQLAELTKAGVGGSTVPDRFVLFWPGFLMAWPTGFLMGAVTGLLLLDAVTTNYRRPPSATAEVNRGRSVP